MSSASEVRSLRYPVALAFEKANFQRSRAASSAAFCKSGFGGFGTVLAQIDLDASLGFHLGEFAGRAAGVTGAAVESRCGATGTEHAQPASACHGPPERAC